MNNILIRGRPIVEISFVGSVQVQDVEDWLQNMTELLNRKEKFVLVTSDKQLIEFPQDGKKLQAIWFKENRELLGKYCAGIARIVRDAQHALKVTKPNLQRAIPCPLFAAFNMEQARDWADVQLSADSYNSP